MHTAFKSLAALLLLAPAAAAQARPAFDFSIANMMRGPELYGREPQRVAWTPDGRWLLFYWNEPGTKWSEPLADRLVRADRLSHDALRPKTLYLARTSTEGRR